MSCAANGPELADTEKPRNMAILLGSPRYTALASPIGRVPAHLQYSEQLQHSGTAILCLAPPEFTSLLLP